MKLNRICYFLLLLICFSSCSSYKNIPYFQNLENSPNGQGENVNFSELAIQPADILGIHVTSKNPEAAELFNYNLTTHVNGSNFITPDNPVLGYRVDPKGNLHLPLLGTLPVNGMTTTQLQENISKLLLKYYLDPVVNVRLINFKVAIYGDVMRPDVYTLQNEQTTLTQALTMAGDLNITARRDILLIRTENGKRKTIRLDLTDKNIFDSPYFFLKNNDEIYVQPDRTKFATVDRGNRSLTLLLSGLSVVAIVVSAILR